MVNHGKHISWMVGVVSVGAILFLTGDVGGWLFLLWPVACTAMMVWMVWGMGGMGRSAPAPVPAEHTRDDSLTHSPR